MVNLKIVTLVSALFASAWAVPQASSVDASPPPNAAMGARLRAIYRGNDWKADPNKAGERAAYFQALLKTAKLSPEQQRVVYPQLADELLRAGDSTASLQALDAYAELPGLSADEIHRIHERRGIAYLRLGEQENCLGMHGQHSCVFPLRASAIHEKPRGAEGAIREYTWLLNADKKDALARWLLNIAYMQLGRYPKDVPAAYLLPPKLFASEADPGEFLDHATPAGVDVTTHAGGVLIEDFDGDGMLDIVTSSSGPLDPMHLFHNNGDGTFSDWTTRAGLSNELGGLNLVLTDYDNDGRPDILVLRGGWWGKYGNYPVSLLHNRGDGTFEDVTEHSGLLRGGAIGPTQTAAWADYDNDGLLDLFIGYESSIGDLESSSQISGNGSAATSSHSGVGHPSLLFHNNGDGTFTEVGHALHLDAQGFVKGVAWGDFNNDGWPDLFVAGYYADSMQEVGRFEAGESFKAGVPHLYRNNHDGTFTDVAHSTHLDRAILTMGANFGDLDNDGFLDIYLGTGEPSYQSLLPNRMFHNAGGERFEDITTSGGFGHLQKGHAIAFADLENRGQEDIFEEMGGAFAGDPYQSALYRNPGHSGHSVTLRLVGTRSNRAAYGARLEVIFHEAPNRPARHVFRTVGAVSSFGGNPMEQHIGIGNARVVDEVRVHWPANYSSEQVFHRLSADAVYRLREGSASPEPIVRKAIVLGQSPLHADALHQPMSVDLTAAHNVGH